MSSNNPSLRSALALTCSLILAPFGKNRRQTTRSRIAEGLSLQTIHRDSSRDKIRSPRDCTKSTASIRLENSNPSAPAAARNPSADSDREIAPFASSPARSASATRQTRLAPVGHPLHSAPASSRRIPAAISIPSDMPLSAPQSFRNSRLTVAAIAHARRCLTLPLREQFPPG